MSAPSSNPRVVAARLVNAVVHEGRSLSHYGPRLLEALPDARDRAFVQALAFGVLRHVYSLRERLAGLLARPLRSRDADLEALLWCGLFQLDHMRVPAHAAVATTVDGARALGKTWACGLVNGVLRQAQRRAAAPPASASARYEQPEWLIAALREAWPADSEAMLAASNRQAPLTLRVNQRRDERAACLARLAAVDIAARPTLHSPVGVVLTESLPVANLPGFADGLLSVQDEAAQLAAVLLAPAPGSRVLDACAAPGGKSAHLLEQEPTLDLLALDVDAERVAELGQTLARLGLTAQTAVADACTPDAWWDGRPFDAILLDAPCSALGIVRRHPDIRLHRRPADLPELAALQGRLLDALWPTLAPGANLLYVTCSPMPAENDAVLGPFLARTGDAVARPVDAAWGRPTRYGRQVLPGEDDMDGFYFARLERRPG